ncbi:MAG: hypothetical protein AAB456_00670 [Patescibacteria group bacterium]
MVIIPSPSSGTFGSYKVGPQPKKPILPSLIVIVVAMLILAAGYYFFFYRSIGLSLEAPILLPAPPLTSLETKVGQLPSFSFNVIDSSFYKSLKFYGALPIVADSLGRANPFVPY